MTEPLPPGDLQPTETPPPGETPAPPVDPHWALRLTALAGILAAEKVVGEAFEGLFEAWMPKVRHRVFANGPNPDPTAIFAAGPEYTRAADQIANETLSRVYRDSYAATHATAGVGPIRGLDFNGHGRDQDYLTTARNRLVGVPDQVYRMVSHQVAKATLEGWDLNELAAEIDTILDVTGQARWTNRAMTIARTEAVGAHNAGMYAGYQDLTGQLGGRWEKVWLATEDHRTRKTHHAADLQRVPFGVPFSVGGFDAMHPHDPQLPPEELINCRCSLLLLRPGEAIDLSNRQLKKAAT